MKKFIFALFMFLVVFLLSAPISNTYAQPNSTNNTLFCGDGNINTAIGCIPFSNPTEFSAFILKWAIGIGGGIAFLLIAYAGIMITTSSGNPDRLKAGQELLTSAISGLIMLVFSIFILRIIGVDILGIPALTN